MNLDITVKVDTRDLSNHMGSGVRPQMVQRVLGRMVDKFLRITWENFGVNGANRPKEWSPLSPNYQRAIKYFGPPKLILTGDLITSIRKTGEGQGWIEAGTDVDYASDHQYGTKWVPARPFFPITGPPDNPKLTPYAESQMIQAGQAEMNTILGQK